MKFALQLAFDDPDACVGMQRLKIGDQQNGLWFAFKFGQLSFYACLQRAVTDGVGQLCIGFIPCQRRFLIGS